MPNNETKYATDFRPDIAATVDGIRYIAIAKRGTNIATGIKVQAYEPLHEGHNDLGRIWIANDGRVFND